MHEQTDKKVKKLKLNKKTLEALDDNQLQKVSGGDSYVSGCISIQTECCGPHNGNASFGGSGCISINTGCC
jgi:hypothetical protein